MVSNRVLFLSSLITNYSSIGYAFTIPNSGTIQASATTRTSPCDAVTKGAVEQQDKSNNDELQQSYDGFQLITKTNKQLTFDETSGRFFETSLNPTTAFPRTTNDDDEEDDYEFVRNDFSSNEMIPTEILFGKRKKKKKESSTETTTTKFPHASVVSDILVSDYNSYNNNNNNNKDDNDPQPNNDDETVSTKNNIVDECYTAWNERDINMVVDCFDDTFVYEDCLYRGTITNKKSLLQHFTNQIQLLPPKSQLVVDDVAVDPIQGNIATRWHVQRTTDGSVVPFTRGCSFYTINLATDRIQSGFRVSEMFIKPNKQSVNALVSLTARVLNNGNQQQLTQREEESSSKRTTNKYSPPSPSSSSSIIEKYFEAWNERDMESALDCFVEDCTYQTEDPVFVETFKGKQALREHLQKNAAVLPSSCRIILDNIALDPMNGNIGTTWHLEINNGVSFPNLRGCSMYTTDLETGLLKTGFDVTEAPIKLPKDFLLPTPLLSVPARLLFGS